MMFNKQEAFRLHRLHCAGCSEYGGHGGGRVSTLGKAREGDSTDAGSTPAHSTIIPCDDCYREDGSHDYTYEH